MVFLGWWAFSYERGTPVQVRGIEVAGLQGDLDGSSDTPGDPYDSRDAAAHAHSASPPALFLQVSLIIHCYSS